MKSSLFLFALSIVHAAALPAAAAETAAGIAAPASENAPSEDQVELARTHFVRGVDFYNAGDHKLSLLEFRRSYELSRNFRVLYNIGQVNQQLGNYANALLALERYLREGGAEVPDDRRAEVVSSVAELQKKIATLEIVFDVDRAEVVIDDLSRGTHRSHATFTLDAGDHRIELRRDGHENATASFTLAAGEARSVELRVPKQQLAVASSVTRASPVTAPGKSSSPFLWVGWIATGTLAIGAGITGVIATSHASELAALRSSPDSTASQRQAEGDKARAFAIASDAMTGAAVLVGLTSLYFTLSSKDAESNRRRESATQMKIGPSGVSLVHRY